MTGSFGSAEGPASTGRKILCRKTTPSCRKNALEVKRERSRLAVPGLSGSSAREGYRHGEAVEEAASHRITSDHFGSRGRSVTRSCLR